MDQWLDSLSEDWVSQPASPRSTSTGQASVLRDAPSPSSNGSQSRIPRYKPRSASNLSVVGGKEEGLGSLLRRANSNDAALKEKTSSNLNASRNRMPIGHAKSHGPEPASRQAIGRHVSAWSIPTMSQDTVQIRAFPVKKMDQQATPDWKRRVLKQNLGKGDLFSPIGLESVFKPPTVGSKPKTKPVIHRPSKIDDIPSSPPSYPKLENQSPNIPNGDPDKATPTLSPRSELSNKGNSRYMAPHEIEFPSMTGKGGGRVPSIGIRPSGPLPSSDAIVGISPTIPAAPTPPQLGVLNQSSLRSASNGPNQSSMSSAPDKARDENISPFYVSRHNTVDGRVEYAAIDMSMRRLRSQMDKLRMQQHNIPDSRSSDHGIEYADSQLSNISHFENLHEFTSQSLPEDLSMGTDAYAANGGFISIHRGGYSNDGSFQRRPLSPSLLQNLDGPSMKSQTPIDHDKVPSPKLPETFSQTKSSTPSSPPKTPKHQKNDSAGSSERPRSSGSPLKLFDKYDTFTNDRLARRMSKFEETLQRDLKEKVSAESVNARSSPSPRPKRRLQRSQHHQDNDVEKGRRISSFGSSELDDHQFPTHPTIGWQPQDTYSPDMVRSDPNRKSVFERPILNRFTGEKERNSGKLRTRESGTDETLENNDENNLRAALPNSMNERRQPAELGQHDALQTTTGKRSHYSPAKDPAPKRRRTLRSSEETNEDITRLRHLSEFKQPPVSLNGRKRKDALYNTDNKIADPEILAMRQIRQPKLPASSPVISSAQQTTSTSSNAENLSPNSGNHHDAASAVDPPTQIVAGALATIALNTVQDITYGSRKASVTTADFFNEAQQIMQLIRNQGRPRSSHTTVDGLETGQPTIVEESVMDDSTKDEFSRPPSREGASPPRLRIPAQTDARVISHLRKFEDQETVGLALSSSLKTLQIGQAAKTFEFSAPEQNKGDSHSGTESDPPNIRIRDSNVQSHKHKYPSSTRDVSISESDGQIQSKDSPPTSGPSTSRSNPTGSSHSSTNRLVIAPETVAHLLSDQMAGMVFDRQKQLWVKRKGSANVDNDENLDHTVSEGTEDDLFGDIPDLSVDEMEELKRVKESMSSIRSSDPVVNNVSSPDQAIFTKAIENVVRDARPRTADGRTIAAVEDSSAPSKSSHFAWSGRQPGTRATSWGEVALPPKEDLPVSSPNPNDQHEAEVEHEISILEGRESRVPKHQDNKWRRARVVTVAFSSPLVDQREPVHENDDDDRELWERESQLNLEDSPTSQDKHTTSRRTSFGVIQKPGRSSISRRKSLSNQSYHARPMSRLDERDELSLVQYPSSGHPMALEVAISTPLPLSRSLMVPPTTGNQSSVSLHLSPLPDFTVHQVDKPLDSDFGQVTRRSKQNRTHQTGSTLSLAAQNLVKNLTDLEPYEPFWDFIRSVDLRDRDLKTLHMLDEFCGGIEELDVSNNQIGDLNGIPSTVRRLNIRKNHISDLAAWNSLYNVQYMDVSGNNLQSVKGFHSLIHLRALKADYNEIRDLNGLEDLDGLISLSVRGNKLQYVDFDNFNLERLAELDVRGNELVEASNLDQLASLKTCDLSYNDLETLDIFGTDTLSNLEILSISNNCLSLLEVAAVPKLKSLNIDNNSVARIENLNCLKQLETLSWREQRLEPTSSISQIQYNDCYEVRNLYLSGNPLSEFAPSTPFLNLHHLELASTGLQHFPPDFGLQCPNVRILNANYNAIHDLRPLLGVVRLDKLFLAGNRISRLRRTAAVLDRVGKGLLEVDLRNNPLTVGFYTPQESVGKEKSVVPHRRGSRVSEDEAEHDLRNIRAYLLPAVDKVADNLSRERLDEDTKLRRRVYEMLMVNGCKALERLDGLEVEREMVGKRDGIWGRLIELGVLKAKGR